MQKEILDFYTTTKVDRLEDAGRTDEVPITHVKIFHKQYPRMPRVALPEFSAGGELFDLLRRRKSSRVFSPEAITLEEMAGIVASCAIVDSSGPFERRTYPSAGSRFPVEIYLIAFNVAGLAAGSYHYDSEHSTLELLWETNLRSHSCEIVSPHVQNPAAAVVLTSVIARAEVKYGARAYPFSLLEAGHMAQNISLMCTRIGIGCCPIGGFVNDTLSKCLDLTKDEIPLYVMALGKPA